MSRRGQSLIEIMVAAGLFFGISILFVAAMTASQTIFRQNFSRDSALQQLLRARNAITADLRLASADTSRSSISQVPGSLGGGADSDALMFLSPRETDDSTAVTDDNHPFWRRNVLYYAAVPTDYAQVLGQPCNGGNLNGYDYNCPIKYLMRVEFDQNPNDNPRTQANCDTLVPWGGGILARPTGYPMGATNRVVANNLLSFRCQIQGGQFQFDLRAVAIADAKKVAGFGTTSWDSKPTTLQALFSVTPQN